MPSILIIVCGGHNTAAMRNTVGGQKTLEANPIGFAISRNLHFTQLNVMAVGCACQSH